MGGGMLCDCVLCRSKDSPGAVAPKVKGPGEHLCGICLDRAECLAANRRAHREHEDLPDAEVQGV